MSMRPNRDGDGDGSRYSHSKPIKLHRLRRARSHIISRAHYHTQGRSSAPLSIGATIHEWMGQAQEVDEQKERYAEYPCFLPYRKFVRIWHDGRRSGW